MGDDRLLANCLAELESDGWDLDRLLIQHPELSDSIRSALRAAAYLHRAPQPLPSPAFRARSRQRLVALIAAGRDDHRPATRLLGLVGRFAPPARRIAVPVAASLVLLLACAGALNASAAALPDTPFYAAKLALERVAVLTALTPQQQAQTHLALATHRLDEARAEEAAGNQLIVPGLLASYDREIATAQADASVATTSAPSRATPTTLAAVSTRIATLEGDRQQVVDRSGLAVAAQPSVAASARPTSPATGVPPTAAPTARSPAATRPASTDHPAPVAASVDKGRDARQRDNAAPARMPVPPQPAPIVERPTVTPASAPTAADPVEALLRDLLNRAMAGDVDGAGAASQQYVQAVQALPRGGDSSAGARAGQRAELELAIIRGPASTRPSLQRALAVVDFLLMSGSNSGVASRSGSARDAGPSRDSLPVARGDGGGSPHADAQSDSSDQSSPDSRGARSGHDGDAASAQAQSFRGRRGPHGTDQGENQ